MNSIDGGGKGGEIEGIIYPLRRVQSPQALLANIPLRFRRGRDHITGRVGRFESAGARRTLGKGLQF
jgi:hypothetical protein